MLDPPAGSQPLLRWAWGPLSVPYIPGTPAYRLQVKTKDKACAHVLPRATAALEPASLPREGFGIATCLKALDPTPPPRGAPMLSCVLRLRTPPHHPGGLQHWHASFGSGPRHASKVGSGADMCPMALHGPWAIEKKKGLPTMACSKVHVYRRHAHVLPRCLQDMWEDDVNMTYKSCGHALQHLATVHHCVADRS
jgi:hypothetical protein